MTIITKSEYIAHLSGAIDGWMLKDINGNIIKTGFKTYREAHLYALNNTKLMQWDIVGYKDVSGIIRFKERDLEF